MNLRVAAMVSLPKFKLPSLPQGTSNPKDAQTGTREVFLNQKWIEVDIYQRSRFKTNNIIKGPSIIEQNDSTTLIGVGWVARVKDNSHLLVRRLNTG